MPPVGFAVLGLGTLAQSAILPAFRGSQRSKLVALVSRDAEKARRVASLHDVAYAYDDLEDCLANPQVEAVYIATPPGNHFREVEAVAMAKRHVLVRKAAGGNSLGGRRNGCYLCPAIRSVDDRLPQMLRALNHFYSQPDPLRAHRRAQDTARFFQRTSRVAADFTPVDS